MPELTTQNTLADAYRVVDRYNQGWHQTGSRESTAWAADYGSMRGLDDMPTLDDLAETRGPLRPVLPVTDEDETEIRELLTRAGRKSIATLAAALEQAWHQIRESAENRDSSDPCDFATRTMLAGREGSWESENLKSVIAFGENLNLVQRKGAGSSERQMRAAGPSRRVDAGIRDQLTAMFCRWVTDPERYTEFAETLASVVSRYCDDADESGQAGGRRGWERVADQYLQPGALSRDDGRRCFSLFYSRSTRRSDYDGAWL